MKNKSIQRTFALVLTLLLTFGSIGGLGLERSAQAAPAPTITVQPVDKTVSEGETTTFSITATGKNLTYQWQVDKKTGQFVDATGEGFDTDTLTISATTAVASKSGYKFRCVVTADGDTAKSVTSNVATLTVEIAEVELTGIAITQEPDKTTYEVGESFSNTGMVVTATYSDGASAAVTGYTIAPSGALAESDSKVTISYTENGITKTAEQQITVNAAAVVPATISIGTQPQPATVTAGSISGSLSIAATVTGENTLSYQWYSNTTDSATGGTAISGATGASLTIPTDLTADTYFYCVVSATGDAASVTSNTAKVTVNAPAPTFVPVTDITMTSEGSIAKGGSITLAGTVTPSNANHTVITWTLKSEGTATGSTVSNGKFIAGNTVGSATITATVANGASATTDYTKDFTIAVTNSTITGVKVQAPASTLERGGTSGNFTATVQGTENPSQEVTWGLLSGDGATPISSGTNLYANNGNIWMVIAMDEPNATLKVRATSVQNPNIYGEAIITVTGASLVLDPLQPVDVAVPKGISAKISCKATVTPANTTLAYKWQQKINNVWTDIAGATSKDYTLTTTNLAAGSYQFRCQVTAGASTTPVTSREATITVSDGNLVLDPNYPADATVSKGETTTLTCKATATPTDAKITYQWYQYNPSTSQYVAIANATNSTYQVVTTNFAAGDYRYMCQAAAGNTRLDSRAATVTVRDTASFKVTSGAGGSHALNGTGTLTFKTDGPAGSFSGVSVNGKQLTQGTDYTVANTSGYATITLTQTYLNTLSAGQYRLDIDFAGAGSYYASTTFKIVGQLNVWNLYADIVQGNHTETTWLGKGEKMRVTLYVDNPTSTSVKWHYSSSRIGLSSTTTTLAYDSNSGYWATAIEITPKYNGSVWVYAETNGKTTAKHNFTVTGMNNLPATGQDSRPIHILIGVSIFTAVALGALYVWKKRTAL